MNQIKFAPQNENDSSSHNVQSKRKMKTSNQGEIKKAKTGETAPTLYKYNQKYGMNSKLNPAQGRSIDIADPLNKYDESESYSSESESESESECSSDSDYQPSEDQDDDDVPQQTQQRSPQHLYSLCDSDSNPDDDQDDGDFPQQAQQELSQKHDSHSESNPDLQEDQADDDSIPKQVQEDLRHNPISALSKYVCYDKSSATTSYKNIQTVEQMENIQNRLIDEHRNRIACIPTETDDSILDQEPFDPDEPLFQEHPELKKGLIQEFGEANLKQQIAEHGSSTKIKFLEKIEAEAESMNTIHSQAARNSNDSMLKIKRFLDRLHTEFEKCKVHLSTANSAGDWFRDSTAKVVRIGQAAEDSCKILKACQNENAKLNTTNATLLREQDELIKRKNEIVQEKTKLIETNQRIEQEKANLIEINGRIEQEKANLIEINGRIEQEKANLIATNERLVHEKANLIATNEQEKANLIATNEQLLQEKAGLTAINDQLLQDKARKATNMRNYIANLNDESRELLQSLIKNDLTTKQN